MLGKWSSEDCSTDLDFKVCFPEGSMSLSGNCPQKVEWVKSRVFPGTQSTAWGRWSRRCGGETRSFMWLNPAVRVQGKLLSVRCVPVIVTDTMVRSRCLQIHVGGRNSVTPIPAMWLAQGSRASPEGLSAWTSQFARVSPLYWVRTHWRILMCQCKLVN